MTASTWARDDVTTVLTLELGFTPDPDAPGIIFLLGDNLRFSIVDSHGTAQLAHNNPLWAIHFSATTPAGAVIAAVRAAI